MSGTVIEFPRSRVEVPQVVHVAFPTDETRGICDALDARHRLRWYKLGATFQARATFYHWAHEDGAQFLAAYRAGIMARTFGVCLLECVQ